LLNTKDKEDYDILTNALIPNIFSLSFNSHGVHVVLKALTSLGYSRNYFIFEMVNVHFIQLSFHKFGCCVVQKCLEYPINQHMTKLIVLVSNSILPFSKDVYGSYVVSKIIKSNISNYQCNILKELTDNFKEVCNSKNSIQLIEKSLEYLKDGILYNLIYFLLQPGSIMILAEISSGLFSKFF
jgi:pumilio RNA-binding family